MSAGHDGLVRSVQTRLARRAREIAVDPNLVLTRYAVERFLYRLSLSPHASRFVLKGALLLLAWLGETLRPTRDADLLGLGELSDDTLRRIFAEVCAVPAEPDAVAFLPETIAVEAIREHDVYGGRRITLQARIGPARITVQVDVGVGDAVTPAARWLEYPSLLDLPRPRLRAYPRETVLAEKLHAMALLGIRNSRMKDYFDVHALLMEGAFERMQLVRAIAATFERRRTQLPDGMPEGLSDAFAQDEVHRAQWRAFLTRNRLNGPDLADLVREIRRALGAVFDEAHGKSTG